MEIGGTWVFWWAKRLVDVVLSLLLLPVLMFFGTLVFLANPVLNPGPLIFRQARVGQDGTPFFLYKLRSMRPGDGEVDFADAEADRICPFGRLLRRYRIDELPQIWNVIRGEMSLIGPRPEQLVFANQFVKAIPEYDKRHQVRPGLSGLSQVQLGYTTGQDGARRKLAFDLAYIRQSGLRMEAYVIWRTIVTVARGQGAM